MLSAKLVDCQEPFGCGCIDVSTIPEYVCNCFDSNITDASVGNNIYVTLGLFSVDKAYARGADSSTVHGVLRARKRMLRTHRGRSLQFVLQNVVPRQRVLPAQDGSLHGPLALRCAFVSGAGSLAVPQDEIAAIDARIISNKSGECRSSPLYCACCRVKDGADGYCSTHFRTASRYNFNKV